MNVLYEESGVLKTGAVLADNATSLQVESPHGKRTKVKAGNVLLRFAEPAPLELMERAKALADAMDPDFLWQCCGSEEFGFEELAREYFGHPPSAVESAAVLLRLCAAPMYFYRRGKGRFQAAPPENLKAALASLERKRQQAEQQARYVEALKRFELPEAFRPLVPRLLYDPDKQSIEYKALEVACSELRLTPARLFERCGALASSHDYHLQRFLYQHFPRGTGFESGIELAPLPELPLAEAQAFSIDDATTTEIDDAFSVTWLPGGGVRVGIHIAAPALSIPPGSAPDQEARRRLSTVYMPGDKITMLPDALIERHSLSADGARPALSMYLDLGPELALRSVETRLEQVCIAANLHHDRLETQFNEATLAEGRRDYPFAEELALLWTLANRLQAARGKESENEQARVDYNFYVVGDRVTITERRRGSPVDKVVAELMIQVNQAWGRQLAEAGFAAIYRAQGAAGVRMTTVPSPHQGLGVAQYAWASSPLRRYVDLVNQRQLIALVSGEAPAYAPGDEALLAVLRDFELTYEAYGEFQRTMERYWCLRWLLQEGVGLTGAEVQRENVVKVDRIPLYVRVPSLPELKPGTRVRIEVGEVDLWGLTVQARFAGVEAQALRA
ncbi:ribonuclease catalytic domain-containing protein [Pelomicrobium sp.]|jgi:exoribonuclease-2|uniref:ribonuclease catalytic domain-containing protein n=1 Tax=Pelomicrobium sp. TaxID=2815319 RepID=UPI002FDDB901